MSTVVHQSVQSCFEPISLSLKLNSPKPWVSDPTASGWSSIQTLSNASDPQKGATNKAEEEYVHPLVKRSASVLSDKSLEMCTENLGSETGTDVIEDDVFSILTLDSDAEEPSRRRKPLERMEARKARLESLPPPLTILQGANAIRVQPHRENGRLVMTAVSTSPRRPSICAERCGGRLTICLVEDYTEEEADELDGDVAARDEEASTETECEGDMETSDGGDEEEERAEQGADSMNNGVFDQEEDRDGKNLEAGGKIGRGEIQRPSRCNESGSGSRKLINWETFCVAS